MSESDTLKKALLAIKKMKQQLAEQKTASFQPVAIIGIGCRFPEANNKQAFWQLLCQERNIISDMPEKRWELLKDSDEYLIRHQINVKGGFLSDISAFDAYFFGISPREAIRMDPQQRMLLEVTYEALEDAGIPLEALAGSNTGVFSTLYASQFPYMQMLSNDQDALFIPTGNAVSMAANRISYLFDLRGPSITFDTACSSSLVALQQACLSLQNNHCQLAIVCAANINLQPSAHLLLSKAKMLSPTGQCHTFDSSADGYIQGEGIGAVILKPLNDALRDNDRIYAVISGAAMNQDGKTNGLTAPNGLQQEALLRAAYRMAECDPAEISYVECHGTGTFLGDPIELEALGAVVRENRTQENPCLIGSVKTNLGHLEPAAGIASLIKVALSLYHGKIPAHLNFSVPNPHIEFEKNHLRIVRELTQWPTYHKNNIAGISSFGFGGTNAHVILRNVTENEKLSVLPASSMDIPPLLILSARDIHALFQLVKKWHEHLINNPHVDLMDFYYHSQSKRSHHFYRLVFLGKSREQLLQDLNKINQTLPEEWIETETIFFNFKKEKKHYPASTDAIKQRAISYINREKIAWPIDPTRKLIDVPFYPWQHVNYWPQLSSSQKQNVIYPFAFKKISSPLDTLQFEFQFSTNVMPEIKDTLNFLHVGFYVEMLACALGSAQCKVGFTVEDLIFTLPLYVSDQKTLTVQLILSKNASSGFDIHFYSQGIESQWIEHASGKVFLSVDAPKPLSSCFSWKQIGTEEDFYSRVFEMRMPGTGSIRWIREFCLQNNEAIFQLSAPASEKSSDIFHLKVHPGLFDSCVQSLFILLPDNMIKPFVASQIKNFTFFGTLHEATRLYAVLSDTSETHYCGDFYLLDDKDRIIAACTQLQMTQLDKNMYLEKNTGPLLDLVHLSSEERSTIVIDTLLEKMALLFSMPQQDIDLERSLSSMGMDSLMAMSLSSITQQQFGKTYPIHAMMEGATILDIARFILENEYKSTGSVNRWISHRQSITKPEMRLFCFPYGGGGASIFKDWQKKLPDTIEVCPIQLPGRENRLEEIPLSEFYELIHLLVDNLKSELDLPFAFLGHSFGSLVGFELARALRRKNLPQPKMLFVSAFPDPRIPTKSLDNMIHQLQKIEVNLFSLTDPATIALLDDKKLNDLAGIFRANGLIEYGHLALNKDIIKLLLPIFVGDMNLVKSYRYYEEHVLDIPLVIFYGKQDAWVAYEDHVGWAIHTRKKCEFHEFDSGHLFIKDPQIQAQIIKIVKTHLSPWGEVGARSAAGEGCF